MRPRSNTRIESAASAVESRCAIVTVVRPADRRRRASDRCRSVAGSTELVASSRMSNPGLPTWARANETSWRSPTESDSPRGPTRVCNPAGKVSTQSVSPSSSDRGLDVVVAPAVASGADVLEHREVEQEAVLRNHADGSTAGGRIDVAEVDAVEEDPARVRVRQAGEELGERRLAAPGLSDDGHVRPRLDQDVDVADHRTARRVRVAHAFRVHGHRTAAQSTSGQRLHDLDGHVEHGEHLPPSRDRRLRLGVDLGQVDERAEEEVRQEQEGDRPPEREPPRWPERRPEHDHDRQRESPEHRGDREHRGRAQVGGHLRAVAAVDRVFHANVGALLEPVRPDHAGTHDALGDLREHLAHRGPHEVEGGGQGLLHPQHDRDERDDEQHDRNGQLPGIDEHQRERAGDLGDRDDPRDHAPLGELRQRVDVGGDASHEHAPALTGLLGQREVVDVRERSRTQLGERALRGADEPSPRGSPREVGHGEERECDRADRVHERCPESIREPVIEDLLDQDGTHQAGEGRAERDHGRERESGAQLGALTESAEEHGSRTQEVFGDREVLLPEGRVVLEDRGAHDARRS